MNGSEAMTNDDLLADSAREKSYNAITPCPFPEVCYRTERNSRGSQQSRYALLVFSDTCTCGAECWAM